MNAIVETLTILGIQLGEETCGRFSMHLVVRTVSALTLVVSFAGCFPRTQTQYRPNLAEQPQSVQFFQGTLIDSRQASFD